MAKKPRKVFVVGDDPGAEALRGQLRDLGHTIISDWPNKPMPKSRLGPNAKVHTERAVAMSDIIVILKDDVTSQSSTLPELFQMIADSFVRREKKEILIVGGEITVNEVRFFHQTMRHFSAVEAVVLHLTHFEDGATVH